MGDFNDAMMRNRDAAVQARTKAQNRSNILQLKLIGQSHPTGLTSNLLKLFEPRRPLEYKPPIEKRKCPPYTGMAQFVSGFAEPGDPEYVPPVQKAETREQKRARIHKILLEKGAAKAAEELQKYDPSNDPNVLGDPYKTLFIAKLNHETTEHRIKREFEAYGPIKRVRLVTDKVSNKPRGYAFVEYIHTRDMKTAYKQADGRKLDNRRLLVDVERGRTVPNWRPRRLGGGLGSTRVGGEDLNQKYSGREPQQIASGHIRSEEPRAREDRHAEREKSRERGRERDQEHSHERGRDRDQREERRRKDYDRGRDRDRERDRGRDRDRIHDRDRDRDRDRKRDRPRERDRDYEHDDLDQNHGRTREWDYDVEPKHESKQPTDDLDQNHGRTRERDYDVESKHESKQPTDGLDQNLGRTHERDYDVEPKHESKRLTERERENDHIGAEHDGEWFGHADNDEHYGHDHHYQQPYPNNDHEQYGGIDEGYQGRFDRDDSRPREKEKSRDRA